MGGDQGARDGVKKLGAKGRCGLNSSNCLVVREKRKEKRKERENPSELRWNRGQDDGRYEIRIK